MSLWKLYLFNIMHNERFLFLTHFHHLFQWRICSILLWSCWDTWTIVHSIRSLQWLTTSQTWQF